jgi:hypothetical protein
MLKFVNLKLKYSIKELIKVKKNKDTNKKINDPE